MKLEHTSSKATILDEIVIRKQAEITAAKALVSEDMLRNAEGFSRQAYSLRDSMLHPQRNGIIAEFKRRSPSKGLINGHSTVEQVVQAYQQAGVSAVSVLTDQDFFGGQPADLQAARKVLQLPILRKDFIIDTYQILEAKAWGADVILLIAAILDAKQVRDFARFAKNLGLSVLLEVHNLEELHRTICEDVDAIGVNNRNLADFTVDIQTSFTLVEEIPNHFIKISESAISDPRIIKELKAAGFQGFLIGENFMKMPKPEEAVQEFCGKIG